MADGIWLCGYLGHGESSPPIVGCMLFDFCFDMGGCFCYDSRLTCFEQAFTIRVLETGCGRTLKREMLWKTKF